jgi:hypothetical protein
VATASVAVVSYTTSATSNLIFGPPEELPDDQSKEDVDCLLCPITQQLIETPAVTKYGHMYEHSAIKEWVERRGDCPLTKRRLTLDDIFI